MEIFESDDKITFDISNTIDANELAERWGVTKKSIDNRRQRGQGPNYFKIGGKIRYDLKDVVKMEQESYRSVDGTRVTES
tara:strand:+ start:181 stop:420 length:240 start_codon:yes stop_codon:yes gene_type:complete